MALVAGRPFLAFLLDRLLIAGFTRALLSVGHMRDVIIDEFHDRYRGLPIEYVVEESPLGTGGAIRSALAHSREDAVFVLNGDTFVDLDYSSVFEFHREHRRSITMTVIQVTDAKRFGRVLIDKESVVGFEEKGKAGAGWINAGVYV